MMELLLSLVYLTGANFGSTRVFDLLELKTLKAVMPLFLEKLEMWNSSDFPKMLNEKSKNVPLYQHSNHLRI